MLFDALVLPVQCFVWWITSMQSGCSEALAFMYEAYFVVMFFCFVHKASCVCCESLVLSTQCRG